MQEEVDDYEEILQTWDQAGERPWDYIVELGFDEKLMRLLEASTHSLESIPLYRGSTRNLDLQVGDVIRSNR